MSRACTYRVLPRGRAAGALAALVLAAACTGGNPAQPAPGPAALPAPTAVPTPTPMPAAPATTRYRVAFTATWSPATHPQDAPDNAHFSPPVGATHNGSVSFWREGSLASEGIRRMAEGGLVSPLDQEIRAAIDAGTAQHLFTGGGINSPGEIGLEFDISQTFPLVTLVTMIAPSPDWFLGVSGVRLFDGTAWVSELTVDLRPWDAGTDSGASFESPDQNTNPRQPITRITTPPLGVNGQAAPLGRFTFTRIGS